MRTYDEREMQVYLAEQVREMLDERTPRPTSRRGVLRKMAGWILLVLLTGVLAALVLIRAFADNAEPTAVELPPAAIPA